MRNSIQKPKILRVGTVANSRLFKVEEVELEFSNGARRIYERMSPRGHQSVMMIPILGDDLLLVREYAVGMESYELGFPKGVVDPGETALQAANRELMEEIGFAAGKITHLSTLTMSPAYFSGIMHIVLAEALHPQKLEGDEPEPLQIVTWPISQMMDLLNEPDFSEARCVSALFLAREHLGL